jgi:GT2 family glycosyltransferase
MTEAPQISIVVPTRDRPECVARLLAALERLSAAEPPFEVIVVDDGSAPATVDALRAMRPALPLRLLSEQHGGPARARNAGAAAAAGDVLLFLDDDVEPMPGILAAHAALHRRTDNAIGLGGLPAVVDDQTLFGITLRGWWDNMRDGIERPGYRYGFRDLLTGHCSMTRQAFAALSGFDDGLRCHEDWEIAYRALRAGYEMRYLPGAVARHHERSDLAKVLRRKFDEGVADVQLSRKHPALLPALPLAWAGDSRRQRLFRAAACGRIPGGGIVPAALLRLLPLYESVKLRSRWRRTLNRLLVFSYWRGVASVLPAGRLPALPPPPAAAAPPVAIDLESGVDAAAMRIDSLRPDSIELQFAGERLGIVPANAGLERLRGVHLRPVLARWFGVEYRRALARAGRMPPVLAGAALAGERRQPPAPATTSTAA